MTITKKTAFGATIAAGALIVVGAAAPAMASEGHGWNGGDSTTSSYSKSYTSTSHKNTEIPVVVAPQVDVLNGDIANGILGGDILNGNAVASGNEVTAPVASGNDTAIGSGNETAIGNGSGNGNLSGNEVSDVVDNVTDTSVSDIVTDVVDVDDILGDVSGWVDLNHLFND